MKCEARSMKLRAATRGYSRQTRSIRLRHDWGRPNSRFATIASNGNDRIGAAAARMETCRPATKQRRLLHWQARGKQAIVGRLSPDRMAHALTLAISQGRIEVGETQVDGLERIAAAGPAHQRIGLRAPARQEADPPPAWLGVLTLMGGPRQWLDHGVGVPRQRAGPAWVGMIVIGGWPGTEVPG